MKVVFKLSLGMLALAAAGTAHAQAGAAPTAPPNAGLATENPVRNGGDTFDRDVQRARDEAIANDRRGKSGGTARAVPATPEEVIAGAEVRDPKGVVVGTIESVSMAAAVIVTETGKAEVPLEAFGKNGKGLLIPMSKADFDKAVADANNPKGS